VSGWWYSIQSEREAELAIEVTTSEMTFWQRLSFPLSTILIQPAKNPALVAIRRRRRPLLTQNPQSARTTVPCPSSGAGRSNPSVSAKKEYKGQDVSMRYDPNVRIAPLASALGLLTACTPSETVSSLVVSNVNAEKVLIRTTDDLSPGNVVHMWHYGCSSRHPSRCGYHQVGDGIVTSVLLGTPNYAFVQLRPESRVAPGDHASKDSAMFYWHSDQPSE
jgi:hypothetical protein